MYVESIPNRHSPPAILLREAWRERGRVRKRTLANLTDWPPSRVEALRRVLRDEPLVRADELFTVETSLPHGHVEAVLGLIRRVGLDTLIATKRSRARDLVLAMIVERLLHPCSKLATTRLWSTTTLGERLGVADADVDELYAALDWLLGRQAAIEQKLAARHLAEGGVVLYDVSSSYYEGRTCALAQFGHDRDGKTGLPIIVYGVMTDAAGRPIATEVYAGNVGDAKTVPDQVETLRRRFGLSRVVLVGDRGMLTQTQIDHLKTYPALGWISALRSPAIRALVESGTLQLSLFDVQHLAEISSPAYPGERLVACFNPLLADERGRKREALLVATEAELTTLARTAARRTRMPFDDATLGQKVGRVINHYKMAKHFAVTIAGGHLTWTRRVDRIVQESHLDGFYVIRTSVAADHLSAADAVRCYKGLARVERAFRCLKGIDVRIRPIHHRTDDHVRAHIFLCVLAYYVEWHLRQAWAPLLFEDETLDGDRQTRDPVAPATPSAAARRKKVERRTADGRLPLHSFETLLAELATRCAHTCRLRSDPTAAPVHQLTPPSPLQARALALLGL